MEQGNFTYILECSDGSLYTGWTNNLGTQRKGTQCWEKEPNIPKSRKPVKLVYFETYSYQNRRLCGENGKLSSFRG